MHSRTEGTDTFISPKDVTVIASDPRCLLCTVRAPGVAVDFFVIHGIHS